MPSAAGLRGDPGTARIGMPRRAAASTVTSEPPVARDSTTTTTSARAARMRLRSGKRNASGVVPGGTSLSNSPWRATSCQSWRCSAG